MERTQKDLLAALLGYVFSLGLISDSARLKAADRLYSAAGLPPFFAEPVPPAEDTDGYPPDTE